MDSSTQSQLRASIFAFIAEHGEAVDSEGVLDKALSLPRALELIDILEKSRVHLLGFEVWLPDGGGYNLDSSEIWYSNTARPIEDYALARLELRRVCRGAGELIAVQFGEFGS